jgi:DNA-3-methyladenine glycosylase I
MMIVRCGWVGSDPLMIRYHDEEWGVPVHDDRKLFEFMVLDAFQAGLSWRIILNKRAGFDTAFRHFEPAVVAAMTPGDVERLMQDTAIVRNRRKIEATISNARAVVNIQQDFGSLDQYLWSMVNGHTVVGSHESLDGVPATSQMSDDMSAALKGRGLRFFGSTVCYAFIQGAGLVNDHLVSCFRYREIAAMTPPDEVPHR